MLTAHDVVSSPQMATDIASLVSWHVLPAGCVSEPVDVCSRVAVAVAPATALAAVVASVARMAEAKPVMRAEMVTRELTW